MQMKWWWATKTKVEEGSEIEKARAQLRDTGQRLSKAVEEQDVLLKFMKDIQEK